MKLWLVMLALLAMAVATVLAAGPDDRFLGGSYDGSDFSSVTSTNIPVPVPKGTVILIN